MRFTQVDLSRWNKLDKCLTLTVHEPEVLEEMCNIKFVDDVDGLGDIKVALIETESGKQFGLMRHLLCQNPGTEVLVYLFSENMAADLIEFLDSLELDREDLDWINPEVDASKLQLWDVLRQDDNGRQFVIKTVTSKGKAERLIREFESKQHKQTYWLKPHIQGLD